MDLERLLIRSLDDLHRSINSKDEYEVLRAAAIIRQLFLDGDKSLFVKVNRKYRRKLAFEVVDQKPPNVLGVPQPEIWCAIDTLDPRKVSRRYPRITKNRKQFFQTVVAIVGGHEYTIRDLVKFVANVMGGVHAGEPQDAKEEVLAKLGELYLFSNLSVPLLYVRSIGRIILESLRETKYEVLGLKRFENAPGLSIHLVVALLPMPDEKENYILDIGTQEDRDRLSIFLDSRGELTLRFIDTNRSRHVVRAGKADCAYTYNESTYLTFDVAFGQQETLLRMEAGGWYYTHIVPSAQTKLSPQRLSFVLGSNVDGTAETNMELMEQSVYSRCLEEAERAQLRKYFDDNIDRGYETRVVFSGNSYMYSSRHPNFT